MYQVIYIPHYYQQIPNSQANIFGSLDNSHKNPLRIHHLVIEQSKVKKNFGLLLDFLELLKIQPQNQILTLTAQLKSKIYLSYRKLQQEQIMEANFRLFEGFEYQSLLIYSGLTEDYHEVQEYTPSTPGLELKSDSLRLFIGLVVQATFLQAEALQEQKEVTNLKIMARRNLRETQNNIFLRYDVMECTDHDKKTKLIHTIDWVYNLASRFKYQNGLLDEFFKQFHTLKNQENSSQSYIDFLDKILKTPLFNKYSKFLSIQRASLCAHILQNDQLTQMVRDGVHGDPSLYLLEVFRALGLSVSPLAQTATTPKQYQHKLSSQRPFVPPHCFFFSHTPQSITLLLASTLSVNICNSDHVTYYTHQISEDVPFTFYQMIMNRMEDVKMVCLKMVIRLREEKEGLLENVLRAMDLMLVGKVCLEGELQNMDEDQDVQRFRRMYDHYQGIVDRQYTAIFQQTSEKKHSTEVLNEQCLKTKGVDSSNSTNQVQRPKFSE